MILLFENLVLEVMAESILKKIARALICCNFEFENNLFHLYSIYCDNEVVMY